VTTLALSAVTFVRRDPDAVFRELHDLEMLVGCVPGATLTRLSDPDAFEARVAIGLGPLRAEYRGRGRVTSSDTKTRTASLEVIADPSANLAAVRIRMAMAIARRPNGSEIRMSFDLAMSERTWLLSHTWVDPIACDLLDRTTRRLKHHLEAEMPVAPLPPAA
jgi:carbon monoxide dehydrogenase subunit G